MNAWQTATEGFIAHLAAAGLAASTQATRRDHINRMRRQTGATSPWDLDAEDLTTWLATRQWAIETRRSVRQTLLQFFDWATKTGRIKSSPAIELPHVSASIPIPHPIPEHALTTAIFQADPVTQLLIRLASDMGLRRSETCQIHERDLIQDLLGYSLLVHGKGRKRRYVPMPTRLACEVRERFNELGGGYLFPGRDHGHLSPRWVGTRVSRVLPAEWSMHSLRHRAATRWYAVSHDMYAVQELLGHSSVVTTQTYVLVPQDTHRYLIESVAA